MKLPVPAAWFLKNLAVLALAGLPFIHLAIGGTPAFAVPPAAGLGLALLGGVISIGHYALLVKENPNLQDPRRMVDSTGLYRLVRHPMYFGDLLLMAGLFLVFPAYTSAPMLAAGWYCLYRLARHEDRHLAKRFPTAHPAWAGRTKLFVPFLI